MLTLVWDEGRLHVGLLLALVRCCWIAHQLLYLVEVDLLRHLHLVVGHRDVIKLLQPRHVLQDYRSVERYPSLLGADGVLAQVQDLEVLETGEVPQLLKI